MPKSHQKYSDWNAPRIIDWAKTIGANTNAVIQEILVSREHPEQAFRSCLGVFRLGRYYSSSRLEAACKRALFFKTCSYKKIKNILEKNLDKLPLEENPIIKPIIHENIRGSDYYQKPPEGESNHESVANHRQTFATSFNGNDQSIGGSTKITDDGEPQL
jgi:hypothetical protein